jgi:hypothetical protein
MKELRGTATSEVAAPIEQCVALLRAVDGYPKWYPEVVREVTVIETADDGRPTKARAKLHVARGPLVRDFNLLLAIDVAAPNTVALTRIASGPSDQQRFGVKWLLEDHGQTHIRVTLDANLSVPRFVPLGGIGEAMAEGFVHAASQELASR